MANDLTSCTCTYGGRARKASADECSVISSSQRKPLSERCPEYEQAWQTDAEWQQSLIWINWLGAIDDSPDAGTAWSDAAESVLGLLGKMWSDHYPARIDYKTQIRLWAGPPNLGNEMPDLVDAWLWHVQKGHLRAVLDDSLVEVIVDDLQETLDRCRSPWTVDPHAGGLTWRGAAKPPRATILSTRETVLSDVDSVQRKSAALAGTATAEPSLQEPQPWYFRRFLVETAIGSLVIAIAGAAVAGLSGRWPW